MRVAKGGLAALWKDALVPTAQAQRDDMNLACWDHLPVTVKISGVQGRDWGGTLLVSLTG